ncbi:MULTISPECIES: winged helix-turn-helix transcriptional regulator [Sphingobacterium]|uniref:Helix-turn-helix transcriptional regulator n=1 Tax=Sphingobacterium litopenaei TaxID=2763500 RepID=A0ABR7Y9U9_9SPHI|nr:MULTISPECIES: helix-turn-helix domain-containing protein [Sphingobacterium]MBD1428073.1 helix-turn-helix transcriptional regulator [Sphingobacterium litopenaei]NGM72061.1 helix-turn-helix transcriptional regulator [Sphingobacterium sp. SGL-16]
MISKPISDPPACTADLLALQDSLEIIGGKWTLLIIHYLATREHEVNTFKKIEHDIPGLSAKVLSKELKTLETNRLIFREPPHTKPVSVKYEITPYGKSLQTIITQLVNWGTNHRKTLFDKK